ncbi:MAG TPA: hypothetical protein VK663_11685 [Burkholderiales bacterium]|nr:hypothetical protein [Burkholderiales bacterium]
MQSLTSKLLVALLLAASLAGCASIGPQESAMDWMQHQPMLIDD